MPQVHYGRQGQQQAMPSPGSRLFVAVIWCLLLPISACTLTVEMGWDYPTGAGLLGLPGGPSAFLGEDFEAVAGDAIVPAGE